MALKVKTVQEQMVNARARFGLEGDKVFDYETSQYLPSQGKHVCKDGFVFDLARVAQNIRENKFMETAVIGYNEQAAKEQAKPAQEQPSAPKAGGASFGKPAEKPKA